MALKNSKDHWAFLEEIEAPMWADLTLEAKKTNQAIDEGWFHTSHPFHHCSSRELKAAFAHSGDGSMSSDFDLEVPSSVSRSRGKHYRSRTWRGEECVLLTKQHPVKVLNGKFLRSSSGSVEEIKCNLNFTNNKRTSRSKISLVSERACSGNAKEKNLKSCSNSVTDKAGESNTSTITSESDQQSQWRNLEVSNQPIGYTSGLVSAMRISLRKSCGTRKASRVEINDYKQKSRDHKSSSGKSSVGSSVNPGYDAKNSTSKLVQNKEHTPDSRNVARMTIAAKNKVKKSNVSNVNMGINNSRKGGISNVKRSAQHEAAKSKAQIQTLRTKAVLQHRVNEKGSMIGAAKAKRNVGVGGKNKLIVAEKENKTEIMTLSQKCRGRKIAVGIARDQKGTKQNVPRKLDRTGFVGAKGKIGSPRLKRTLTNVTQGVYFR